MKAFSNLVNLESLDLENCSKIHGGLIYLKGEIYIFFNLLIFTLNFHIIMRALSFLKQLVVILLFYILV